METPLISQNREKVIRVCTNRLQELEASYKKTEASGIAKLQGAYEKRRKKIPAIFRWVMAKNPPIGKLRESRNLINSVYSLDEFLYTFFERPIQELEHIRDLCKRATGEEILLKQSELDTLTEKDTFTIDSIENCQIERLENLAKEKGVSQAQFAKLNADIKSGVVSRVEGLVDLVEEHLQKEFIVRCHPVIPFKELHPIDQREGPPYRYPCERAKDEEEALDEFHNNNPIKVLDDFAINVTCIYHFPEEK
jgi:hypothetical protein